MNHIIINSKYIASVFQNDSIAVESNLVAYTWLAGNGISRTGPDILMLLENLPDYKCNNIDAILMHKIFNNFTIQYSIIFNIQNSLLELG